MSNEQRLNDLEIRFTHQQRELRELSDVVYEQAQALDRLTVRVQRLERMLRGFEEDPNPAGS